MAMNPTNQGQQRSPRSERGQPTRRQIQVAVARETLMRIAPLLVAGERLALDDLLHDIEQEELARIEAAESTHHQEAEPEEADTAGGHRALSGLMSSDPHAAEPAGAP